MFELAQGSLNPWAVEERRDILLQHTGLRFFAVLSSWVAVATRGAVPTQRAGTRDPLTLCSSCLSFGYSYAISAFSCLESSSSSSQREQPPKTGAALY